MGRRIGRLAALLLILLVALPFASGPDRRETSRGDGSIAKKVAPTVPTHHTPAIERQAPIVARSPEEKERDDEDGPRFEHGPGNALQGPAPHGGIERIEAIGGADQIVNTYTTLGLQSETAIASNTSGTVLVAGYNDANGYYLTPQSLSGVSRSVDGGQTWSHVPVGPNGEDTFSCPANTAVWGDPDLAYDPVGDRFFYSTLFKRPGSGSLSLAVFRSDATASTWTGPYDVTLSLNESDKEFIDVNPASGRLMVAWVQLLATTIEIRTSYSDDGGVSWSPAATLTSVSQGTTGISGPVVRFLPGASNATSQVYVAWRSGTTTTTTMRMARSTDGGATWAAAFSVGTSFPNADQIVGVDRVHTNPEMDIDPSSGKVFLVYQRNNAGGEGDIAVAIGTGTTFDAPKLLDSNPGLDRAQFYPAVSVDRATHRVHVVWFDQDAAAGGDLLEVMHIYSDDAGVTWSRPAPLFDRPFHASYGDSPYSEPNMGDYLDCVARGGVLHAVAAGTTRKTTFDDGLPYDRMQTSDVYYDRLQQSPGAGFNLDTRTDLPTGGGPEWVAIADVSGDAKPDLLSANYSGSVSVRLGNGTGAFGARTDLAAGAGTYVVVPGDLNHDGIADLVTANFSAATLSVLLGTGGGAFAPAIDLPSGSGTACVASAKIDGDAHPDLVASSYFGHDVAIFLGNGSGGFAAPVTFGTGHNPNWVAVGDVNGDAKVDLVTANTGDNSISVLLGNGAGGFGAKTDFPVGAFPLTLAL